ncbi:MAG: type IV pilin [Asgard group archaeon]|nr:type IV pilin [Asgard group archaeon]
MTLGKMILKRKKAVSPVIATILLIALTVTAAAIVYFVVVPLLRANPELTPISYGKVPATIDQYEITIQNNGGAIANIDALTSIELTKETITTTPENPTQVKEGSTIVVFPTSIEQGGQVTWTFTFNINFTSGSSYVLKIFYDAGKVLTLNFVY